MAIIPRYRDTRYWYPILTLISGYHVTDIGTPDIDPDIDPDIGYMVYDIGDMMTRYRVCTRMTRQKATGDCQYHWPGI